MQRFARQYPVLFLTGPRQSGKTTLARSAFPDFEYLSLEDLQNRHEAADDPRGFLRRLEGLPGAILDEAQNTPDLFSYIQGFADEGRGGPLIMTGSQNFLLSERISQSLAGRTAVLELLPFSIAELSGRTAAGVESLESRVLPTSQKPSFELNEILFSGLFPRIHNRKLDPSPWLDGYIRTYVERDVRSLSTIVNLESFTRFLGLCAGRTGQLLNSASLGADAGVDHSTARRWISILQAGYVVDLLRPYFKNHGKRLVKSPKLYFVDTGLLCRLLGIRGADELDRHPLRGAIFENLIVNEFRKLYLHNTARPPLYFWRDSNGREVDVIVDLGTGSVPIEIKAGATVASDFMKGLDHYTSLSGDEGGILVYSGDDLYVHRNHQVRPWWACT